MTTTLKPEKLASARTPEVLDATGESTAHRLNRSWRKRRAAWFARRQHNQTACGGMAQLFKKRNVLLFFGGGPASLFPLAGLVLAVTILFGMTQKGLRAL